MLISLIPVRLQFNTHEKKKVNGTRFRFYFNLAFDKKVNKEYKVGFKKL